MIRLEKLRSKKLQKLSYSHLREKYAPHKILFIDLETLPNQGFFFDVFSDRGIPLAFVVRPKSIITISYKWLGDEKATVIKATPYNDKKALKEFIPHWEEANYIVFHYGNKFDKPFLAARLMVNGLPPLADVATIDTYLLAKKHFGKTLNSNKLDHLGDILGVGRKNHTDASLWVRCAQGDKEAIQEMADYNAQDVDLLEAVFVKMLPYIRTAFNINLFLDQPEKVCNSCGHSDLQQKGFYMTGSSLKHRFQCKSCKAWNLQRPKK